MKIDEVSDSFPLPDGIDIIGPEACMDCGVEGEIPQKWFFVDPPIKSKGSLKKATELLKTQEGYESFDNNVWAQGTLASVSWCPKCGSEDLIDGY